MRKLATIRKVSSVSPIEGADKIELVHIDGWQCVSAKGQLKEGQPVVYFEIDSALPADDNRYEFLRERCLKKWMNAGVLVKEVIRIKTIKLRGVLSQGLAMSIEDFPELKGKLPGEDVTEVLRVQHYDELAEEYGRITGKARLAGDAKGNFPVALVPKTDEERLANLVEYFETKKGVEFECTFKADGSSMTVLYSKKLDENCPINVCSRNLNLKDSDNDNAFWTTVKKYNIPEKLTKYCESHDIEIAIQGELVGPGINSNRDKYEEHHYLVFRVYNISEQRWLTPEERYKLCEELGLEHVYVYKKHFKVFDEIRDMEQMSNFVNLKTLRGNKLEGLVFKTYDGTCSFKHINPEYLLSIKD